MASTHTPRDVAVLIGSLRKDSINRKAAEAVAKLAPAHWKFRFVEIGGLSFYNQDLDGAPPADWTAFRDEVRGADAVLFVTPEYNRSVPGVLKNAIDIGSRPYGHSVFDGKPAAVITVSPGGIGGFGANHHLRQSLAFLNMPTLQQPEMYVGGASTLFGDNGEVTKDETKALFEKFIGAFAAWVEKNAAVKVAAVAAE
jgi:chromate reductase